MSLEPSQGQAGQEPHRSGTSAETGNNPIVQGDSEGEQLPANVTPGSDQEVATYPVLQDPFALNEAGIAALHQYWASGQVADLNRAVECWYKALNLTPPDSPNWPALLYNLGTGLHNLSAGLLNRYARTGDPADLDAAITAFQQAVQATPPDSPNWPTLLSNLGAGLLNRYARTGDPADLDAAITAFQQAVQATPPDSPNWPILLYNLSTGLLDRYARTGDPADLDAAIIAHQQAIQATPLDSPDWPILLNNLSTGLLDRYVRTGDPADLDAAITAHQQAVQATPLDSPDWPTRLNNLGAGLLNRYARTGDPADLDAAITASQQAIQAIPPDSPDWPGQLSNLGAGLLNRYARTGDPADLDAAITASQQAIQATPPDSPNWPGHLNNLGAGLRDRYTRTGDPVDLEAAITASQQAIQATPPDSPYRPALLYNLGLGLSDRYVRTGNLADLDAAITAFQETLPATPFDSPDLPLRLNNLGTGLLNRYARTGNPADLELAITASQLAIQATSLDSPDRPGQLSNLGLGLSYRHARTGNLADLDAGITALQQAVQATSLDSPDRPRQLSNLGAGLSDRYVRTGNLADLDAGITAFQQAVQATSLDSPDRPRQLSNLGAGLSDRHARTGNLADLDAGITAFQQAVQATSLDSPYRSIRLNNLGLGLRYRYVRTGNLADLEAAISTFQQAVQATSPDSPNSPDQPTLLNNLGVGLLDHYARTGDLADLDAAISAWEKDWSIPHPGFAALPVTYQLGEQRQGAGIAASLITAHLERAKQRHPRSPSVPPRVLEIAEGSKSRLLTQLVGRGPLPLPVGLLPAIAAREQHLLAELTALDSKELAIHDHFASTPKETALQRFQQPWVILRQETLRELEDLWTGIARLGPEGAAYVALRRGATPTWQEFAHLTDTLGPATALLSFFTTTDRALLFLLRSSWPAPRLIEVPLNQAGWADLWTRFFHEVHRYQPGLRRSTTWDQPLHPLFTNAQHHLEGVERLILAPQGIGHLLPWGVLAERAGSHTSAGQPLPLVTLPALSILPRLRQRPHVPTGPALVVGDPHGDLRHAEAEAKAVAKRFGTNPLLGPAAKKSSVLARFPDATLIHLATHAFFDANNPLESGIVLADGVLTAREILQHHLQANLLVLSACESGRVGFLGGEELAGLSQAFLQTGVRSLLVSLWRVNDPATAALIQAFYTAREAGADKALALRQAMTQIQQDSRWTHPYYWGAFVLMGDWD